jgi:hypothetical protein
MGGWRMGEEDLPGGADARRPTDTIGREAALEG